MNAIINFIKSFIKGFWSIINYPSVWFLMGVFGLAALVNFLFHTQPIVSIGIIIAGFAVLVFIQLSKKKP